MPRPRQQVIEALKETDKLLNECNQEFIENLLGIMFLNYIKTKNLGLLVIECKRIVEAIKKD